MEPFIGQIQAFGCNFAIRGWAFCDGQLLPISQNTALFSLLGTTFGGDGRTTFQLPDLRGRSIVHPGSGPGLSPISWGQKGGNQDTVLTSANLPSHNHSVNAVAGSAVLGGNSESGGSVGNDISSSATNADGADHNVTGSVTVPAHNTNPTGSNTAFSNRSPFLGIYYSIALVGIFPSRS